MNLAPTNPKDVLLEVCDDLLAACGHLRAIREKAGEPWPNSEAKRLINAVLDCRNAISSPHKNKLKTHTS
jgi:hypothetical protein